MKYVIGLLCLAALTACSTVHRVVGTSRVDSTGISAVHKNIEETNSQTSIDHEQTTTHESIDTIVHTPADSVALAFYSNGSDTAYAGYDTDSTYWQGHTYEVDNGSTALSVNVKPNRAGGVDVTAKAKTKTKDINVKNDKTTQTDKRKDTSSTQAKKSNNDSTESVKKTTVVKTRTTDKKRGFPWWILAVIIGGTGAIIILIKVFLKTKKV